MDPKNKKNIILLISAILLIVLFALVYKLFQEEPHPLTEKKPPVVALEEPGPRRHIDGVFVEDGRENLPLTAIMIENHPDARPQAGLDQANLVIEAPVEGGITRFLAVYDNSADISRIGPVRSARPYYLDWANELQALYGHVGGSPEALRIIKYQGPLTLNQYFRHWYYWRSPYRLAPHNVYTSSEFLIQALEDYNWLDGHEPQYQAWQYKDEVKTDLGEEAEKIVLDYSYPLHKVEWLYDAQNNHYVRHLGGVEHCVEAGQEINAKNIAVQLTDIAIIDAQGRRRIKTVGTDKALVFLDGRVIEGCWKKPDKQTRIKFYDLAGQEIVFNAGTTWIEVFDKIYQVKY